MRKHTPGATALGAAVAVLAAAALAAPARAQEPGPAPPDPTTGPGAGPREVEVVPGLRLVADEGFVAPRDRDALLARLRAALDALAGPAPATAGAAAPATPAAGDDALRRRLRTLLERYDGLMSLPANHKLSLAERRSRIDALVGEMAALGPDAVPALVAAVRADAAMNNTPRQMIAIRALAAIEGEPAFQALAGLLDLPGWGVQMAVVAQLAGRGEPGLDALRAHVAAEPDFRVRGAILKQLARAATERDVAIVERLARADPDPNVRRAALRALTAIGGERARATLAAIATGATADTSVRQAAIQGLASVGGDGAIPALERLIDHDPDARIRAVAILGLQVVGTDAAVTALERIATAADDRYPEDLKARALGALRAIERQRGGLNRLPPESPPSQDR